MNFKKQENIMLNENIASHKLEYIISTCFKNVIVPCEWSKAIPNSSDKTE